MGIKEIIVAKLTSARFFMAVIFSTTYCFIMVGCTIALLHKLLTVETYVALLAAFTLIVREISDAYFKQDRPETTNGGNTK